MSFCLPPDATTKFIAAIRDGTITPSKMAVMTSEERRAAFAKIVGEDNARDVNAQLESKLLLKDYNRGMVTWAKSIAGLKEPVRRDLISRIEKMDHILNPAEEKEFLADYASQKIGATVTSGEAKAIFDRSHTVQDLKKAVPEDSPIRSPERMAYGLALDEYHQYLDHLMGKDKALTLKEFVTHPSKWFSTVAGVTKGVLASMDNSYFGRQGIKMLYTNPGTWANAFAKSWVDMGKELVGIDAMKAIRADVLSRPNSINGKYKAGGYALGVHFEEGFPSALPERIPVLGRLYKASESAFNGAALRMRSDYADKIIAKAEESGINALNPDEAKGLGTLVNSMTGRGSIGKLAAAGDNVNAAIFSLKFLKSNFDTLTMHRFGYAIENEKTRSFVRKEAATNLVKIVGSIGAIMMTSNMLAPGSVNFDPRSSDFGKLKFGNTTIDVTGGMAGMVSLVARLFPWSEHDGVMGSWSQSQSGKWSNLRDPQFGMTSGMDAINNYWEGKVSPLIGMIRDYYKGQNFQGQKVTPANMLANLTVPLPIQTFEQLQNEPNAGVRVAAMIADALGFSANPPNASSNQGVSGVGRPTRQGRATRPTR